MDHFYESIPGWFDFAPLYAAMVARFPSGSRFLEIGTYAGRSFAYLGVEIANSGKDIELVGIDGFGWTPGEASLESFTANLRPLEGRYAVLKGNSVELAKTFPDRHFDFVFIDANHAYESVRADILAYLPKVRPGGVLAGHDYSDAEHLGVYAAVNELFPGKFRTRERSCWVVEVDDL